MDNLVPEHELRRKVSGPLVVLDLSYTGIELVLAGLAKIFPANRNVGFWQFGNPSELPPTPLNYWPTTSVKKTMDAIDPAGQAEIRLLSGHFSFRLREVLPPSRLFATLIRNPIDRILMSYASHATSMNVSLTEAIESQKMNWNESVFVNDYQVRSLSGDPVLDPDVGGAKLPLIFDFDYILHEISENFVVLGVAERLEETVVLFARQLGIPLSTFANVSSAQIGIGSEIRTEVPQDIIAELEHLNRYDQQLHVFANKQLEKRIGDDPKGFAEDIALLRKLSNCLAEGKSFEELCNIELESRGGPFRSPLLRYCDSCRAEEALNSNAARLSKRRASWLFDFFRPTAPEPALPSEYRNRTAYLDLMEDILINRIYSDVSIAPWSDQSFDPTARSNGSDWPAIAHTMIGKQRIKNVRTLCETVLIENIPGDFIETGVWRGGATIMMRAVLQSYGDRTRTVFVADSFSGVPRPDEKYSADSGDLHFAAPELAISQAEVAANFRRYRLLDRQVRFLPGLFKDTLPAAPIERLAVMRLDGDLYESTMDALTALYDRLSIGGFVIIDDYGAVPGCKTAVDEFRSKYDIRDELQQIDWAGVYWRKLVNLS